MAFLYKNGIPARIIITNIILTMLPYLGLSSKDVTNFANKINPMQAEITNWSKNDRCFFGSFIRPFIEEINSSYMPTITAIVPPDIPGIVIVEPIQSAFKIVFICIRKPPYIIVYKSIEDYYMRGLCFLLIICKIIR